MMGQKEKYLYNMTNVGTLVLFSSCRTDVYLNHSHFHDVSYFLYGPLAKKCHSYLLLWPAKEKYQDSALVYHTHFEISPPYDTLLKLHLCYHILFCFGLKRSKVTHLIIFL